MCLVLSRLANASVKWQHRHRIYTGMSLLPFFIPNATILWTNQNIAHENQAGHCAVSHGKLHLVLSSFIFSFNQTQISFRLKENAWFLYIWKRNTSFVVDQIPVVKGLLSLSTGLEVIIPAKFSPVLSVSEIVREPQWSLWICLGKPSVLSVLPFLKTIKKGGSEGDLGGTKWYWGKWNHTNKENHK